MIEKELVDKFNSLDLKILERQELGVHYNFKEANKVISEYINYLGFLINSDDYPLPEQEYKKIESNLRQFIGLMDQILQFDSTANDAANTRQNIISQINNSWNDTFNALLSTYGFLKIESKQLDKDKKEIEGTKKDFNSILIDAEVKNKELDEIIKNINEEADKTKKEIQRIKKDAQEFSAKDVVTNYSKIFSDQAEKHEEEAKKWWSKLKWFIVLEIILATILILAYIYLLPKLDPALSVGIALIKLFILSAGFLFITQAVKSLNAQNHLAVINRHRANALASFKAFLNSINDDQARNTLTIQAAKAIYDTNVSGYLSKDDSGSSFSNVEIIKNIIDGAKR